MRKFVDIYFLLDVPAGALNMGTADPNRDNVILVKKMKTPKGVVPYVSAQAFRYWLRETLQSEYGWIMSPTSAVSTKQAYTEANPIKYPDDDVFGYMRATKEEIEGKDGKIKKIDVTRTRASPLKVGTLISLGKSYITEDFGVMSRHTDGSPILHSHEFFSGILEGRMSLSVNDVGRFIVTKKSGYQNLIESEAEGNEQLQKLDDDIYILKDEQEIKRRISDPILALRSVSGGANRTLHLSDVTPKFVVLCLHEGGNYFFGNLAAEYDKTLVFPRSKNLEEVLADYSSKILSNVYIGMREGFLDEMREEFKGLHGKKIDASEFSIKFGTPIEMIVQFVDEISH